MANNGNGKPKTPVTLHYKIGQIYAQNKMNKWGKGMVTYAKDAYNYLSGNSGKPRKSGFGRPSSMIEGVYYSETEARQLGMEHDVAGLRLAGCYVYPYVFSHTHGDPKTGATGKVRDSKGRETVSSSDIVGVKNLKWVIDADGISKHYLQNHCYQRFLSYEEELAQYWGVRPISPTEWGAKWDVHILSHVSWRMLIVWDITREPVYLHHDGLVNNDLQEPDMSMMTLEIAKMVGKAVATIVTSGAAAGAAGAGLLAAEGGKATLVANAKAKNTEMQNTVYRNSGKTYGPHPRDEVRLALAEKIGSDRVEEAQDEFDKAQKKFDKEWGQAKDFRAPRLFSGGKTKFQGGIADWLATTAVFDPLRIEVRSSRSYENRWRMKMNSRILNRYFNFEGEEEIQMKPGFGMERGKFREMMINIHGWTKFSSRSFFGISEPNPLFKLWCKDDIHIYQRSEWRPVIDFSKDLYEGYTKTFDFVISDRKGFSEIQEHTTREVHVETNRKKVSGAFVFCLFWVSDENACLPNGRKNSFYITDAIGGSFSYRDRATDREIIGSESRGEPSRSFLERSLRETSLRLSDHLSGGECEISGRVGDKECSFEKTRWKGGISDEEKKWTKPWTEENIAPYRGKPYKIIRWGENKTGRLIFGSGSRCNTIVARFLRGVPDEEIIHTKPDEAEWVLERDESTNSIMLGWKSTTSTPITNIISRQNNPLDIKHTSQVQGISGLEGWGNMPPDTFGGANDGAGVGVGNQDFFQTLIATGGVALPETNPLGIQSQVGQREIKPDFAWDNIPQNFKVDIPQINMEKIGNMNWDRTTNPETNRAREDINARMNQERNKQKEKVKN